LLAASAIAAPAAPVHPAHQAGASQNFPSYGIKTILNGANLSHKNSHTGKSEALTKPDDITQYGGTLFTAFQNGVGPQGQAATDGNADSTIVAFGTGGSVLAQWDVTGKVDGLTANPDTGEVIATVNEDAKSSLYDIEQGGGIVHYAYNQPLPHNGGTDAISFFKGQLMVSASAPGTSSGAAAPNAKYPAVYTVTLNPATKVATIKAYYGDEADGRVANQGKHLGADANVALTDPDSSAIVPARAPRFRGDYVLNSQGDQELIFSSNPGSLWVLKLPRAVDDVQWATSWGDALYATDNAAGTVVQVDGRPFWPGTAFVSVTPCNANSAPATCPAPPKYPANYLGLLNMSTGQIVPVEIHGGTLHPQGLVFVGPSN
jgi:hypothetical protein